MIAALLLALSPATVSTQPELPDPNPVESEPTLRRQDSGQEPESIRAGRVEGCHVSDRYLLSIRTKAVYRDRIRASTVCGICDPV